MPVISRPASSARHAGASSARHAGASSALRAGMKALIACDSGEVVAGIVDFVVSQHAGLRVLSRALARADGTPLATAVIALNGLRCYLGVRASGHGRALMA